MTNERKQVGFLGGTFDPIHIGHLNLALEAKEKFGFDEVILCPNHISPFKQKDHPSASSQERLSMLELALEDIQGLTFLDYEVRQQQISYTIDTLRYLKKMFSHQDYFLILGEDHLKSFMRWKDPLEIIKLAPLKIGSREGAFDLQGVDIPQEYHKTLQEGRFRIHNLEISSTHLRERLSKGLYCRHLVPPKVVDYIETLGLYSTHSR